MVPGLMDRLLNSQEDEKDVMLVAELVSLSTHVNSAIG
jgi:hypothetical protein